MSTPARPSDTQLILRSGRYPIGYDIFEGNTFEGKTLIPVLKGIERRYRFGKPVVVALDLHAC